MLFFYQLDCSGLCDMLDNMPVTIMAKNYSHCPLKKRPVPVFEECPGEFIFCISFVKIAIRKSASSKLHII